MPSSMCEDEVHVLMFKPNISQSGSAFTPTSYHQQNPLQPALFFVSSLFVKKPCRIQGLLMVMTLALLVYAVTQRRLRQQLARQGETVPNQINQPTERPTLRWVFQLLEGIHRVRVAVQDQVHDLIEGLNEVQIKILRLFGEEVCRLYQISPG